MANDQSTPAAEGRVTATRAGDALVITNHTTARVWTFVAGQDALITMLWAPSLEDDGIAPGSTKQVQIDDIPKGDEERQVIVYWWHAVTEDGERVPGDTQSITVEL